MPVVSVLEGVDCKIKPYINSWFAQLQTKKFHGLFKDFSRTNYSSQGQRFI